jgi:hypothetical protein
MVFVYAFYDVIGNSWMHENKQLMDGKADAEEPSLLQGHDVLPCHYRNVMYSSFSLEGWRNHVMTFCSCTIKDRSRCHCHKWYDDWLRAWRPRGRSSSPGRVKNVHFSISSRPAVAHRYPVATGSSSLGITRPERELHSPPTSSEVKKTCIYTFTPPIRRHGLVLS